MKHKDEGRKKKQSNASNNNATINNMEMEQKLISAREQDTLEEEPIWFKILNCLGGVFPSVCVNGKYNCNWKVILWCLWPITCIVFNVAGVLNSPWGGGSGLLTNGPAYKKILIFFFTVIQLAIQWSLSFTRSEFSNAIIHRYHEKEDEEKKKEDEEKKKEDVRDKSYINKRSIQFLILSIVIGCTCALIINFGSGIIFFGIAVDGSNKYTNGYDLRIIGGMNFTSLATVTSIVIIRCMYFTRVNVEHEQVALIDLAKGTNVKALTGRLLEINKNMEHAFLKYLQTPLALCLLNGIIWIVPNLIRLYKQEDYLNVIWVIIIGLLLVGPLWFLTRIDKFYMWTLRQLLHFNTIMPHTEHTNLLTKYDTIAPMVMFFGMVELNVTRGRVASIILAIFGGILPQILLYLYRTAW